MPTYVIGGPTASGKTRAAAWLAHELGTEVISTDARQFYRDIPIGTAQPTQEERLGVPHHFLGHLSLERTMSAAEYAREALPVLHDLLARHGNAVVVGGSGLYIDALCFELDALPPADARLREVLHDRWKRNGIQDLQDELQRLDPVTWQRIDRNNPHRLIRAIEVCRLSGRPMSGQLQGRRSRVGLDLRFIALHLPRTLLYDRIDSRVDRMLEAGLEDEARRVMGHRALNSLRTVGYPELFMHFDGALDRAAAIALIKQHSRNYAKRQLTWLRRDPHWHWVDATDEASLRAALLSLAGR